MSMAIEVVRELKVDRVRGQLQVWALIGERCEYRGVLKLPAFGNIRLEAIKQFNDGWGCAVTVE
jgi:hypothetical protein